MLAADNVKTSIAVWCAALALAFLLLAGIASPALGQAQIWPVARLADQPEEVVQLRDARGNAVAGVSRDLMRQLLDVQQKLQQQAGFAGELVISDGRAPNAFAANVRGRSVIGITAPMLGLLGGDLDAYAALLGHEIAHHVMRHGQQRQSRELSLGVAEALFGVALGAAGVRHGRTIAGFSRVAVSGSYSRDEERDADRLGVEWMAAAGFDPQGALRLHERLLQSGRRGIPVPFLQTHPAGEERMAHIRQQIAGLAPAVYASAPPMDTAAPATDAELQQSTAIDAAAPGIDAQASQIPWPPPNWLPVVPAAELPAVGLPVEPVAVDRQD